jgi:hypothetical protein
MSRPKQPVGQPLPVRLAVIDHEGRFRALVENFDDAIRVFIKLNLDDSHEATLAEAEHMMILACWSIEPLVKPLVPRTTGRDLLWASYDRPAPNDADGFVIWLPVQN